MMPATVIDDDAIADSTLVAPPASPPYIQSRSSGDVDRAPGRSERIGRRAGAQQSSGVLQSTNHFRHLAIALAHFVVTLASLPAIATECHGEIRVNKALHGRENAR